jgi:hypothetical protein
MSTITPQMWLLYGINYTQDSKDWLAWNQDNVSESGDMSIRGLLFQ